MSTQETYKDGWDIILPESIEEENEKFEKNLEIPSGRKMSKELRKKLRRAFLRTRLVLFFKRWIKEPKKDVHPSYKKLVRILSHMYKSVQQAKIILGYLRTLPFFEGFLKHMANIDENEEALLELSKRLTLERFSAGSYVFKQGDPSNDKYYIILQGTVSVIVKHDKNVFNQEFHEHHLHFEPRNSMSKNYINSRLSMNPGRRETKFSRGSKIDDLQSFALRPSVPTVLKPSHPKKHLINVPPSIELTGEMGVKTKEMYVGEAFGEKALLSKDAVRSTTIQANVDTDLIVISKEDYLNIVRKYDKRRLKKADFMKRNIPNIEHVVSEEIWEDMFHLIKEFDFPKGSILADEYDYGNIIFFLCEGFCQLSKKVVAEFEKEKEMHPGEISYVDKVITLVGAGSIMGEEILYESQPYKYTITVNSSSALIYYIERNQFLMRFPNETCKAILDHFEAKEKDWRLENIEKATVHASKEVSDKRPITTYLMGEKELIHSVSNTLRTKYAIYSKINREKNQSDLPISEEDMNELRSRMFPSVRLDHNIGIKDYQKAIVKAREQKKKYEVNLKSRSKSPLQSVRELTFSPVFRDDIKLGSQTDRNIPLKSHSISPFRQSPSSSKFFKTEVDESKLSISRPAKKKFDRLNDPNSTVRNVPPRLRTMQDTQEFAEKYLSGLEAAIQRKVSNPVNSNSAAELLKNSKFDFGEDYYTLQRLPSGVIVRSMPKKPKTEFTERSKSPQRVISSEKKSRVELSEKSIQSHSKLSEATPRQKVKNHYPSITSIPAMTEEINFESASNKQLEEIQLDSALVKTNGLSPISGRRKEPFNRAKTALRLRKIVHQEDEKISTLPTQQASFETLTPTYLKNSELGNAEMLLETKKSNETSSQAMVIKSFVEKETSNPNNPLRYASPLSKRPQRMRPLLGSLPPGEKSFDMLYQNNHEKEHIIHEQKFVGVRGKKKYVDSLNPQKQKMKFFMKVMKNSEVQTEEDESHELDGI